MDNVRLLLRGSCSDEHDHSGAYALVELSEADIKSLALRRKAFVEAKEKDALLYDQRYRARNEQALFYADLDFMTEEGSADGEKDESIDAETMLEGMEICELAVSDRVSTEGNYHVDSEIDLIVVDEDGVFWESHGEVNVFTSETVDWDHLFEGRL